MFEIYIQVLMVTVTRAMLLAIVVCAIVATQSMASEESPAKAAAGAQLKASGGVKGAPAIKKMNTPKNTAHVELDRTEDGDHVVHVFEMVMDTPDEGHTATFNWYHVNARSGKIRKEF